MALIPRDYMGDDDIVSREINGYFENPTRFFTGQSFPRVDIYQTENDVVVKAEIPGVSRDDLNLYIDDNAIKLSGQSKKENEYRDEDVFRTERHYGSFSRTIPLPVEVKSEEAKAQYKDGILSVTIPKVEPSKLRGKKIDIQ